MLATPSLSFRSSSGPDLTRRSAQVRVVGSEKQGAEARAGVAPELLPEPSRYASKRRLVKRGRVSAGLFRCRADHVFLGGQSLVEVLRDAQQITQSPRTEDFAESVLEFVEGDEGVVDQRLTTRR